MNEEQARHLAISIAGVRAAVGASCLLVPAMAKFWVGPGTFTPGAKILSRSLAGRDVAMGLGTGMADRTSLRKWTALSAFCDAVDALGTFAGYKGLGGGRRFTVTVVSAASAVAGFVAAANLGS